MVWGFFRLSLANSNVNLNVETKHAALVSVYPIKVYCYEESIFLCSKLPQAVKPLICTSELTASSHVRGIGNYD